MERSTRFNFNLPSSSVDDIADINQISENFRIIDEKMVESVEGKGLSENDYTAKDKEKVQGALQKNQGAENAGKFMSVDENGNIVPGVLIENKQDKFAKVTERDGTVTVKSTVSNDRPPEFVFKNGVLELLAMHLQFGDGQGEVSLNGLNFPDDSLNINVNGNRIRNLADPIFDNDAVNKKYLEIILEQKFSEFINVAEVGQ
jgi:hypothetical protein